MCVYGDMYGNVCDIQIPVLISINVSKCLKLDKIPLGTKYINLLYFQKPFEKPAVAFVFQATLQNLATPHQVKTPALPQVRAQSDRRSKTFICIVSYKPPECIVKVVTKILSRFFVLCGALFVVCAPTVVSPHRGRPLPVVHGAAGANLQRQEDR